MGKLLVHHTTIHPVLGELASSQADALIHPTNNFLWFSPEFLEALKKKGCEDLEEEAQQLGPIETGQAVPGSPGGLACGVLIHAAAWGQDMMTNKSRVRQAVLSALEIASGRECRSVAIPPVGTGMGGFSLAQAIEATFFAIIEHCINPTTIREVFFLAQDETEQKILERLIQSANDANPPSG
jgi:O-acetyl-ADP-ribose deacetylase (regulator of RNase III)